MCRRCWASVSRSVRLCGVQHYRGHGGDGGGSGDTHQRPRSVGLAQSEAAQEDLIELISIGMQERQCMCDGGDCERVRFKIKGIQT